MPVSLVAEIELSAEVEQVTANDSARTTFSVQAGDVLYAVSGEDLSVLARWTIDPRSRGAHACRPDKGFALESGVDSVVLRHLNGPVWSVPHAPWDDDFEAGCAWFDASGQPFAAVPGPDYEECLVLSLARADGEVVAGVSLPTGPTGVRPIHQPDGWVGLAVGEGQHESRAWWVRALEDDHDSDDSDGRGPQLGAMEGGWADSVLVDAHPGGRFVLTVPLGTGPLAIRSFPELEVLQRVATPRKDMYWDLEACFVGDRLVARLSGPQDLVVAVHRDGQLEVLDLTPDATLVPAASATWLTVEEDRIRRWRLTPG